MGDGKSQFAFGNSILLVDVYLYKYRTIKSGIGQFIGGEIQYLDL